VRRKKEVVIPKKRASHPQVAKDRPGLRPMQEKKAVLRSEGGEGEPSTFSFNEHRAVVNQKRKKGRILCARGGGGRDYDITPWRIDIAAWHKKKKKKGTELPPGKGEQQLSSDLDVLRQNPHYRKKKKEGGGVVPFPLEKRGGGGLFTR